MDLFEEDNDYFKEDNDYFGFYEDAVPREAKDENSKALYEGNLSTIKPHSEYISLEQEIKHGHQETTGYNELSIDPAAYTLKGSHKAWIGHSRPRHMPPKMPYSVIARHIDSNLFQDEVPVNLMSDMFQLSDNLETDTQFTEWEKKNTRQRKAEKNPYKFGSMNSRDFVEVHNDEIRRPNSGTNDRHRKVVTSRGPRDSRMRLPMETAIKFFDVQDRLGFNQPSKAVEWLIKNSSSAIDQLLVISPSTLEISAHLTLNSDSLPFLYRDADDSRADFGPGYQKNMGISDSLTPSLSTESSTPKEKSWSKHKTENPRKNSVQAALANSTGRRRHIASLKEITSKARERARERTKEKRYTRGTAISASPHMNPATTTPEMEAFTLQQNTASAFSENTFNDSLETSVSRLYCVAPTFKIGVQEMSLNRFFLHQGRSLPAHDSVKELAENSYLIGHSNLSFNYSQSEIQSSVQTVEQCYKHQPEKRSTESTGSFHKLMVNFVSSSFSNNGR